MLPNKPSSRFQSAQNKESAAILAVSNHATFHSLDSETPGSKITSITYERLLARKPKGFCIIIPITKNPQQLSWLVTKNLRPWGKQNF